MCCYYYYGIILHIMDNMEVCTVSRKYNIARNAVTAVVLQFQLNKKVCLCFIAWAKKQKKKAVFLWFSV